MSRSALIIVDVQNDFLPPDGSLAVQNGREVLPILHQLLDKSTWDWDVVIASQDYHPERHISFASTHGEEVFSSKTVTNAHGVEYKQDMWPDHCVIGTKGAEIDRELRHAFPKWTDKMKIVRKGRYSGIEAYSVFEGELNDLNTPEDEPGKGDGSHLPKDQHVKHRQVTQYLQEQKINKVVVVGLATDYCVLFTALSSLESEFQTCILAPAVRGIKEDGVKRAFEKVESEGGNIIDDGDASKWEDNLKAWLA